MNKEKFKDVVAGVFSLFFIAMVFYLYFFKVFNIYSYNPALPGSFDKTKNRDYMTGLVTYTSKEHNSCHINVAEPTIVLRMDDVRAYVVQVPYLVDEVIGRNMSITLGVIPQNLEKRSNATEYLIKNRFSKYIEMAQHGTAHNESDINISEEDLFKGYAKIERYIGVKPVTYIPPYNKITPEAAERVSEYFRVISGRNDVLKEGEIAEIGQNAQTYFYSNNKYVPVETIIDTCNKSLQQTNICVVTIHPQEYSSNISKPDDLSPDKFNEFKEMLGRLQQLNATFSTFNELVSCKG